MRNVSGDRANLVTLSHAAMSVEELIDVAGGAELRLSSDARSRIIGSRGVVNAALDAGKPVYGLNTGLGHDKDVALPRDELRRIQELLVSGHAGGVGPRLPTEIVRAAMAARINGMARGGSGASLDAVETLIVMLNRGVHPIATATGSVGAGDLPQMAAIASVAIGRGWAEYMGEVLDGSTALARAGIAPLVLQPKDGLTLMSANGVSIGHGAFVVARAARIVDAADVAVALSLEAVGGNPSIVHPAVGTAKPFAGQIEACRRIESLLEGSYLMDPNAPTSIQDPLSFRVAPQVHGAAREFITFARSALETELNSMSDNPLVEADQRQMIHNGNFHPMVMALAFDALRTALAHVAQVSERRMSHLWDATFQSLDFASLPPSLHALRGLQVRYPAAAVFAEVRQLAGPATLDIPPLDIGVEDHATGAPLSVQKTDRALDLFEFILAAELMMARDLLVGPQAERPVGIGARSALNAIEDAYRGVAPAASAADAHEAVVAALKRGQLAELG
ncbi:MAG: aromatic amino acid lyase [Actinomycetota bacterium]|nr:aromatic amino acid lyase [Actinomycetota bacterium]